MSENVSVTEDCRWFIESAQYVPDFVAHINNIPYPDQLVALVTYCLYEAVELEDDRTPGYVRKNDKKYDTRVVLSYADPTTGTGWAPDIQLAGDAYADFMEYDFRRVTFDRG